MFRSPPNRARSGSRLLTLKPKQWSVGFEYLMYHNVSYPSSLSSTNVNNNVIKYAIVMCEL